MKKDKQAPQVVPMTEQLYVAITEEVGPEDEPVSGGLKNYRRAALMRYTREIAAGVHANVCVVCGFGIQSILEVAHLDQDRSNNSLENLAVLCPNCHKMQDIGLFPDGLVLQMRDHKPKEDWKRRIKDAGEKAAATRRATTLKAKRSAAAKKAVATKLAKAAQPDPT